MRLTDTDINERAYLALTNAGYQTVEEVARLSVPLLLEIPGIGNSSLREIQRVISGLGVVFERGGIAKPLQRYNILHLRREGMSCQQIGKLLKSTKQNIAAAYNRDRHIPRLRLSGKLLRGARLRGRLTQRQLAEMIGVQQDVIRRWESNRTQPSGTHLARLLVVYACNISDLLIRIEED